MLQEGVLDFNPADIETITIKKRFEDDLYVKYVVEFSNRDDRMDAWGYAILIKDINRLKEFVKRTQTTICWDELEEEDCIAVGDFVLKFYCIQICGLFGGEIYLKRLTRDYPEKNALFVFIDNSDCQIVLPCNKDDKFCFLFPYYYWILFQNEV